MHQIQGRYNNKSKKTVRQIFYNTKQYQKIRRIIKLNQDKRQNLPLLDLVGAISTGLYIQIIKTIKMKSFHAFT